MKNTSKKKELQAKLNHYISEFAGTLIKKDSKKIKKSIKKASRLIAKAILKNSEESEVSVSLIEKATGKKNPFKKITAKRKNSIIKRRKPIARKQVIKSAKPIKAIFKTNGGLTNNTSEVKIEKKEIAK